MDYFLKLIAGLLPIVLICLFIYLKDSAKPEKPKNLVITFLLGALVAIGAYFIEEQIDLLGYQNSAEFWPYTLYMFIGVALVEELLKLLAVLIYPFRKSFFEEPLDGIVYYVFVAMGFATVETIAFTGLLDWEGIIARATLAIPAHASFAMIAGYYLGRAKVGSPKNKVQLILTGLAAAVFAHGAYDWFIFNPFARWMTLLGVVVLIICWGLSMYLTRKHAQGADYTPIANRYVDQKA